MLVDIKELANVLYVPKSRFFLDGKGQLALPYYRDEAHIYSIYKERLRDGVDTKLYMMAVLINYLIEKKDGEAMRELSAQWAATCAWEERSFEEQELVLEFTLNVIPRYVARELPKPTFGVPTSFFPQPGRKSKKR